jgi:CelD/BcsL family acetyltransferase involved in cellulose biosynthesis
MDPQRRRKRSRASPADVAALRSEWDRLADRTGAGPFLRPGWIEAWWSAFGAGRLEVLREEREGRVRALLPIRHRHGIVSSPSNSHSPDFGLLREDRAAGMALLDEMFARRPAHVSLGFVSALGPSLEELTGAAETAGYRSLQRTLERSPFVTVDGDWEEYERSLDRNLRKDLRRCRRRLEELGRVMLEVDYDTAHLDEALAVEGLGWKRAAGTAIVSAPHTARFYTEVAQWAEASGRLRLIFLRVDGRPIAFHLALEDDLTYFPLKGGFDPAFRAQSPGRLLIHATLERAFEVGLRRYEFLGTSDAYKLRWATETYDRVLFQAFPPSPVGRAGWFTFAYGRPLAKRAVDEVRRRRAAFAPRPQAPSLTLRTPAKPSQRSIVTFPPSEEARGSARRHWPTAVRLLRMRATAGHWGRWRGLIILIGGVVVLAGVLQTSVGHRMLRAAGLSQEQTGYTSLSFLHPQSLPEQITPAQRSTVTSFAIHNATGVARGYHWSVSLVYRGRTHRVHAGSVHLAPGRRAEITRSIAISCTRGRVRIVVSLESPAESIDTWMACRPRGG